MFTIVKPEESQKALLAHGKRTENCQVTVNKSLVSSHLVKKVCQHTHIPILPELIAPNDLVQDTLNMPTLHSRNTTVLGLS